MNTMNKALEVMMAAQKADRALVLSTSIRGESAFKLASMAAEHSSSSAAAAANLLLSMQDETPFNFLELLRFDPKNRAHADLVMLGYQASDFWPAKMMEDAGYDGVAMMQILRNKWR